MQRYLAAWGFPLDAQPSAERWTRVMDGNDVVAVIGEKICPDPRDIYITDLYPGPGRKGVLGVYAIVEVLKRLADEGLINGISWVSEAANVAHTKALKRILGVGPVTYFWRYGNGPSRPMPQRSDAGLIFGLSGSLVDGVFERTFAHG
ncbi:MAG: hypothetical protein JO101_06185 [Candidatus Eremiobacteraeota bacterium]|nr:hypothetical protein [Candidatus Eremiobacteraeota bacterium]